MLVRWLGEKHNPVNENVITSAVPSDQSVTAPWDGSLCSSLYSVSVRFMDVAEMNSYYHYCYVKVMLVMI